MYTIYVYHICISYMYIRYMYIIYVYHICISYMYIIYVYHICISYVYIIYVCIPYVRVIRSWWIEKSRVMMMDLHVSIRQETVARRVHNQSTAGTAATWEIYRQLGLGIAVHHISLHHSQWIGFVEKIYRKP